MKNFLAGLVLCIAMSSCGKSDTIPPVITVATLGDNQVFSAGQSVAVSAKLTDEEGLHMVHLIVMDNTGGHIIHFEEHYDGREYNLNKNFTAQAGKTYSIEISGTDHNDNQTKKLLTVSAN